MASVAAPAEQEYYRDAWVIVTNQRAVIGNATYPLETITAVKRRQTLRDWRPVLLMLVVGSVLVWCLLEQDPIVIGVVAALFLGLTLILASETKPKHTVILTLSATSVEALASYDRDYIVQIVAALTQALQQRAQAVQQPPFVALPVEAGAHFVATQNAM